MASDSSKMDLNLFQKPLTAGNHFFKNNEILNSLQWYTFALTRNHGLKSVLESNLKKVFHKMSGEAVASQNNNRFKLKLIPSTDLEATANAQQWISIGNDPSFLIDGLSKIDTKNSWFEVKLIIDGSFKNNLSKLYLDLGSGYSEKNTIDIQIQPNILSIKTFKLEKPVVGIRFDPMDTTGHFSIIAFELNSITEKQAMQNTLCQLLQEDILKNSSIDHVLDRVNNLAKQEKISPFKAAENYLKSFNLINKNSIYFEWITRVEAASLPDTQELKKTIDQMVIKPLISIVMPVYNTPAEYLKACIDSVLKQTYPHWELCIADDKSTQHHVRQLLSRYQRIDKRIKVNYRTENGHISKASNSALELATGEYIALLDHDDVLPAHALFYVAEVINQKPESQIIYSDEDKIDEYGNRFEPHFKSDWNPDLFFSQNYVSHLGVYRRDIIQKIKGFRVGVEGSQDQDLLLRCLPHTQHENIVHIPKVLYHWRALQGSTALDSGEKNYTTKAGLKALRDYFNAIGRQDVKVGEGQIPNTYRVQWPIPVQQPLVSLLIPTRDKKEITEIAVNSILNKTSYSNYEIIIIDNGSVEPQTLTWFKDVQKDSRVRVLRYDKPFNYSAINNFGAKYAKGSVLGLVNNDVEVISPEWLTEMVSHAIRPDIGCVGAKLYYGNDTIQHAGVILGIGGVAGHSHKHFRRNDYGYFSRLRLVQEISAVTAACLIVKKTVFKDVNGLDEANLTVAFNDVDFCLKVGRLGFRNLWTPYAELYHHESVSRGAENSPVKIKRFNTECDFMMKKWSLSLLNDPFYNSNLSNKFEDFRLRYLE